MAFIVKDNGGKDFKKIPPGTYVARCFQLIDLGEQLQDGKYGASVQRKARIQWEVFGEDEEGQPLTVEIDGNHIPMTIGKTYTFSISEKAGLRKDLVSWRGREFTPEELQGFDITNILGAYCMLSIIHTEKDGKTYTNISAITPLPSAFKSAKPEPFHENVIFTFDEPDMAVFKELPDWMKETMQKSPQYAEWASMESF